MFLSVESILGAIIGFVSLPFIPRDGGQISFRQDDTNGGVVVNAGFSRFVEHLMGQWDVKGLSLAVVRPDGEVEYGSWGNRTEDGDKMTPDTLFNIGSCGKAFLSASMGILMDDFATGKNQTPLPPGVSSFDWDTKVEKILPDDWKLRDPWASEKANIQDILSHLSGLPRHDFSYSRSDKPREAVRRLRYLRPSFELREQWAYNNQMYMAGAHIISTYAESYMKYAKERIFRPLSMNATTFSAAEAERSGKFSQGWNSNGRRVPYPFPDDTVELIAGPGGVITSAVDMSKWLQMLLHSGSHPLANTTVLPKSAFDAVTTARAIVSGKSPLPGISLTGYGMGWARWSYKGHEIIEHNGGAQGISSHTAFLPHAKLGVFVFANGSGKSAIDAVAFRVIEDVLKLDRTAHFNVPEVPHEAPPLYQDSGENTNITNTTVPPLSEFAGRYSDPGYGSLTFCAPSGNSSYCRTVLSEFEAVDSAIAPGLYASTERTWGSHVRLVPLGGTIFGVTLTALYSEGYGADQTPFEDRLGAPGSMYDAVAYFDLRDGVVRGFGLFVKVPSTEGGLDVLKRNAEVWFEKVR